MTCWTCGGGGGSSAPLTEEEKIEYNIEPGRSFIEYIGTMGTFSKYGAVTNNHYRFGANPRHSKKPIGFGSGDVDPRDADILVNSKVMSKPQYIIHHVEPLEASIVPVPHFVETEVETELDIPNVSSLTINELEKQVKALNLEQLEKYLSDETLDKFRTGAIKVIQDAIDSIT